MIVKSDIFLTRNIDIKVWRVEGTIATIEKRPEYLPIVMRIVEKTCSNAQDIAKHLFCDDSNSPRKIVAERMLDNTRLLKLTTKDGNGNYELTEDGTKFLTTKELFSPHRGVWNISVTSDALLPSNIVKFQPAEKKRASSTVHDSRREMAEFQTIPDELADKREVEVELLYNAETIRIDDLSAKGIKIGNDISLKIDWNVNGGVVELKKRNGEMLRNDFSAPKELDADTIWLALLEGKENHKWDEDTNSLVVHFDEIDDKAKNDMKQNIEFPRPDIANIGFFDRCIVKDVRLTAYAEEADAWAQWRLENSINEYATKEKFDMWVKKAHGPFKNFDIAIPTREGVAKKLWQDPQISSNKKWYTMAAVDWNL